MKKLAVLLLVAGLVCGLSTSVAAAQSAGATITGKAVRWDGSPISGATIALLSGPLETAPELASTTTAADGSYTLTAPTDQPVWAHIRTFGTWWGYSYTPMSLRPGEVLSQVYFALGPRNVQDAIVLPTPISNVAPEVGTEQPPAAPPPVSNVKPITGVGDEAPATQPAVTKPAAQPQTKPQSQVKPLVGGNLPQTGAETSAWLTLVLALAAAGLGLGLGLRRQGSVQR